MTVLLAALLPLLCVTRPASADGREGQAFWGSPSEQTPSRDTWIEDDEEKPEVDGVAQKDTGIELGARAGYGMPLGQAIDARNGDLNGAASGQIPIWLDLGYRATSNIFLGVYGSYGFVIIGDEFNRFCGARDFSCSSNVWRMGLEGHYHFLPRASLDPWLGVGVGYEWYTFALTGGDQQLTATFSGPELVDVQAGADWELSSGFFLGPFVSFSLGQYATLAGGDASASVDNKALHQWLMFGARFAHGP